MSLESEMKAEMHDLSKVLLEHYKCPSVAMETYGNPSFRKALRELEPRMRKVKDILENFEERVVSSESGIEERAKFATASELQQIIAYHCGARIMVHTCLYEHNETRIVYAAFPVILTEDGAHVMEGAYASGIKGTSGLEKEALNVETRAIRLALRKIGFRTEDKLVSVKLPPKPKALDDTKESTTEKEPVNPPEKVALKSNRKESNKGTKNESATWTTMSRPIYTDEMEKELNKERQKRGLSWDKFIKNALGLEIRVLERSPNARVSFKRLEGSEKTELYEHYITNSGEL